MIEIQDPLERICNLVPGIWNPWHGIQNRRLSWIPLHWAKCKIRETAGVGDKYNSPFYICFLYLFFSITLPALRISSLF